MKKIAIIPTLLTLGNAVCGFASISYASKIDAADLSSAYYFALSGWLIIFAMVFDALDGYVARLSKTASKFGGELDSLCDGVSFGAAPAFLMMRMGPGWDRPLLHQILAGIATLYLVCALLRLARFNVENTPDAASHKKFRGLPSPGAAGCLASLAILRGGMAEHWPDFDGSALVEIWATLGGLIVALLMVSRVPYPHLTKQMFLVLRGRRHFSHLIEVLVIGLVLVVFRQFSLVLVFWIYGLGIPLRYSLMRNLRQESLPVPMTNVDDPLPH